MNNESIAIENLEKTHLLYRSIKSEIILRLEEFNNLWENGTEQALFRELVFCLLTPQTKAESSWKAVEDLEKRGLLFNGNLDETANALKGVRFRFNKTRYIIEARKKFIPGGKLIIREQIEEIGDIYDTRDWLVGNVKGMGYKESTHFLRNIGISKNLAILDRHILKNLKLLGLIEGIPKSLSKKIYVETEEKMLGFSQKINIPVSHLDLVLWCKETGKIFK